MIIAHNLAAMNTGRQHNIVVENQKKESERLSSGYRINRAADDAAGLAISEKMRGQVRGLRRASENLQDGIAMVQTADGAMGEISSILQRMRELSVQGANDTNHTDDRAAIQMELNELVKEIDRIGEETEFNKKKILQGVAVTREYVIPASTATIVEYSGGVIPSIVNYSGSVDFDDSPPYTGSQTSKTMDFSGVTDANKNNLIGEGFKLICTLGCRQEFAFVFRDSSGAFAATNGINDTTPGAVIANGGTSNSKVFEIDINSFHSGKELVSNIFSYVQDFLNGGTGNHIGHDNQIATDATGNKLTIYGSGIWGEFQAGVATVTTKHIPEQRYTMTYNEPGDRVIQAGANAGQIILLHFPVISSNTLGLYNLNVSSHEAAGRSISYIDNAIKNLSSYRSQMGAYQNRMEHAVKVDDTAGENMQASESLIRDQDMASAIMNYTKNDVLAQAGVYMMLHAKASSEAVLQLLNS